MTTDHKIIREGWLPARPILDRAAKGRDEGDAIQTWIRRHDEYV